MTDAVERGARLIAHEHGSEVFDPAHVPYEFTDAERDQYRSEAEAVIRDVGGQLLQALSRLQEAWGPNRSGVALFDVVRTEVRRVCDVPVGWRPDPWAEVDR